MPRKTFACTFGHRFFPEEAESLKFRCDKDDSPLLCPPEQGVPGAPDAAEVAEVFGAMDAEPGPKPE